ncbi:hypothetical protein, partial [Klebsiella pneumoniae]|uniref:hypothetical protein n=1 Tax=Klebsiella pneumoniae TaxID=573 RepID=UPI003636455B
FGDYLFASDDDWDLRYLPMIFDEVFAIDRSIIELKSLELELENKIEDAEREHEWAQAVAERSYKLYEYGDVISERIEASGDCG